MNQPIQTQHVHWKRAFNPDWFGGWCLPDGKDMLLTIAAVDQELVTGEKGAQEMCLVIHWKEDAKPMICNKTNAKMLEKLAGSAFMDDWIGLPVQLYFDPTVKFGKERVGGIRIRQKRTLAANSAPVALLLCSDCGQKIADTAIDGQTWPAAKVAAAAQKKYGRPLCWACVTHLQKPEPTTEAETPQEPAAPEEPPVPQKEADHGEPQA